MKIIVAIQRTLLSLCFIVIIIIIRVIIILHRTTWDLLPSEEKIYELKYILLWTQSDTIPFVYMGEGQSGFISRNCDFTNCFVTANRDFLSDYRMFDVIAFHGPEICEYVTINETAMPNKRWPHQQFVFASIESPENYPICSTRFDSFFNWTWTYKLDSEIRWGYFVIKNSEGNIIGPNKNMHWLKRNQMEEVSDKFKEQLKSKSKAVAWFVSNCITTSRREVFALSLKKKLFQNYKLNVDIFGNCTSLKCSRENEDECYKMIEKDYYFYLSFENAFSEDYVTEKLLIPLQHNVIPIVYGGANYTRFLPQGSYLNARKLGKNKLASKISELIKDPEEYAAYFKWKNHYSYHKTSESSETDEYCKMCALLNDKQMMRRTSIYQNFYRWWAMESCKSANYEL